VSGVKTLVEFLNKVNGRMYGKRESVDSEIEVSFSMNPPATFEQISAIENKLGKKLPHSFKDFLVEFNGGRIYDFNGLDGLEILRVQDIPEVTDNVKRNYDEDWRSELIVFARYIGEGNYLAFDSADLDDAEYSVVDCFTQESPSDWETISANFDVFVDSLLKTDGNKFWLA